MSKARLFAPFMFVVLLFACTVPNVVVGELTNAITGSGQLVTINQDFSGFSRLQISHAFKTEVTQGQTYSVKITIDDNLEEYLEVLQRGDVLSIGLRPDTDVTRATMEAAITMPELTGLDANGASTVRLSGFQSNKDFSAELSGASRLGGDIRAGDVRLQVSGASRIELQGTGQDGDIEATGASNVSLEDFVLENARVEVSGASRAVVNVTGELEAKASGSSHVEYLGDPSLGMIEESGSSTIRAR